MFGQKKRKEKRMAAIQAAAKGLQDKVGLADKMPDAGERYLAYQGLKTVIRQENNRLVTSRTEKTASLISGLGAIGTIGGLAAILLTDGVALPIILAAVGGGGLMTGASIVGREGDAPFEPMLKDLDKKQQALLDTQLADIADSPHFSKLYDNYSAVKKAFTKAAAREAARSGVHQPKVDADVQLSKPRYQPPTP